MPLRYANEREKAEVIRQLTGLTVDEFETLVPLVQTAFVVHREAWTLEGRRCGGRRSV